MTSPAVDLRARGPTTLLSDEDMTPIIATVFAAVHVSMLTLGLQICLCFYSLSVYAVYPREVKKQRKPFLVVSFVILALFTLTHVMDSWVFEDWAIESSFSFSGFVAESVQNPPWGELCGEIANILINLIADALLIYRCFAIWRNHRLQLVLVGLPSVVFLASVGCGIAEIVKSRDGNAVDLYIILSTAWQGLSVLVTVLVTASISYRLIMEQKRLSGMLGRKTTDKYLGASAILIESALPYTLLGIAAVILSAVTQKAGDEAKMNQVVAVSIVNALWYCSSALCPQFIIFRVATGRSYEHDWEESQISRHALSQSQLSSPEGKKETAGPVLDISTESASPC